ncbi:MAG: type II secretion system protein [Lachnospiraceae bacterium]|nr:type II secretion system protein [Lachnospiraceae bacterium]
MRNRKGFTLVEVVIASMLAGMVLLAAFPLITAGRNMVNREQKRMEAAMVGDGIFEAVANELRCADRVFLGDLDELTEYMEVSDENDWDTFEFDLPESEQEVLMEAETVDDDWIWIKVSIEGEEELYYEREEIIPLLNLSLDEERAIEGTDGVVKMPVGGPEDDGDNEIWYQKAEQ